MPTSRSTSRRRPDHRPQLEREALRLVATGALLILGCAALGAWAAASIVIHLTTPKGRT